MSERESAATRDRALRDPEFAALIRSRLAEVDEDAPTLSRERFLETTDE